MAQTDFILASVDFDYRTTFDYDGLLQRIIDVMPRCTIDGALRFASARGDDPLLVQVQFRTQNRGSIGQGVIAGEWLAQRDAHGSKDARQIAAGGQDAGADLVLGPEEIGGLAGPLAAGFRVDTRFLPRHPVRWC